MINIITQRSAHFSAPLIVVLLSSNPTEARSPDYDDGPSEHEGAHQIIIPDRALSAGAPTECAVRFTNKSEHDVTEQKNGFKLFPPLESSRGKAQTLVAVCNKGESFLLKAGETLTLEGCICYCLNPNYPRGTVAEHDKAAPKIEMKRDHAQLQVIRGFLDSLTSTVR